MIRKILQSLLAFCFLLSPVNSYSQFCHGCGLQVQTYTIPSNCVESNDTCHLYLPYVPIGDPSCTPKNWHVRVSVDYWNTIIWTNVGNGCFDGTGSCVNNANGSYIEVKIYNTPHGNSPGTYRVTYTLYADTCANGDWNGTYITGVFSYSYSVLMVPPYTPCC